MSVTRRKNIEVYFLFQCLGHCFEFSSEILVKNCNFSEILLLISESEAGGVLSKVLKISRNWGWVCLWTLCLLKKTRMQKQTLVRVFEEFWTWSPFKSRMRSSGNDILIDPLKMYLVRGLIPPNLSYNSRRDKGRKNWGRRIRFRLHFSSTSFQCHDVRVTQSSQFGRSSYTCSQPFGFILLLYNCLLKRWGWPVGMAGGGWQVSGGLFLRWGDEFTLNV